MLRLGPARQFHDVERADKVRGNIGLRVFEAVAHAGLCGEMDDDLGIAVGGGLLQRLYVLEHAGEMAIAIGCRKDARRLSLSETS